MGLAHQAGNEVTLSYRQGQFSRIKQRNAERIEQHMRSGKVKVLFNSVPIEFKPETVVLEHNGKTLELANDFVWIFAGGTAPFDFLRKIGVRFGIQDMSLAAGREAKEAAQSGAQSAVFR